MKACLIGLACALLVVGLVSGTLLRHLVQIIPIAIALILLRAAPARAAYAALPIFIFWTLIVILIWLFLLGLSRFANGHYTTIEIASTVVMAVCSVLGAARSIPLGRRASIVSRVATFIGFAVLQLAVMFVSFLKPIANR